MAVVAEVHITNLIQSVVVVVVAASAVGLVVVIVVCHILRTKICTEVPQGLWLPFFFHTEIMKYTHTHARTTHIHTQAHTIHTRARAFKERRGKKG